MPDIGWPELVIILVIVMLLFGAKRLPEAARSLGKSMRILKAETKGLRDDGDAESQPQPQPQPMPAALAPPVPPAPLPTAQPVGQPVAAQQVPAEPVPVPDAERR